MHRLGALWFNWRSGFKPILAQTVGTKVIAWTVLKLALTLRWIRRTLNYLLQ
jgi:hypothetical protein